MAAATAICFHSVKQAVASLSHSHSCDANTQRILFYVAVHTQKGHYYVAMHIFSHTVATVQQSTLPHFT
jgi:hypothetical protein